MSVDPFGLGVDSYTRMSVVLRNFEVMARDEWFAMLGDAWAACDNIADSRAALRPLLLTASRAELDLMMTVAERKALDALPERISVWRGCYAVNRPGLSWTTDRAVAELFVTLHRYARRGDVPLLRQATVRRDRAVLKLDRNESEVIAPHVFGIVEHPLSARHAPQK